MARKAQPLFTLQTVGEVLKEHILKKGEITQDALAEALGVSRLTVNQLINDKRSVTAEMALRLAQVLETSPEFWLDLQRDLDLAKARMELGEELQTLPTLRKQNVRKAS